VYQKGLGSIHDKSQRVAKLAGAIAEALGNNPADAISAGQLAKADLLTEMVGEFPELQGVMGHYYAKLDGEPNDVAIAIGEHYLPRFAGDELPVTSTGQAVSIADRLDTLTGIFALGKRPSGNKDPFALRRLAFGLVRILIEGQIDLDLKQCIQQSLELQPVKSEASIVDDIYDFIVDRLKNYYLDGQNPLLKQGAITAEQFEAVRQRMPVSPLDFHHRLNAVAGFAQLPEGESLAAANKRIANILKAAKLSGTEQIDAALLTEPAEIALFDALTAIADNHADAVLRQDYGKALSQLAELRAPVDRFFDNVMVNADDAAIKANRLALLLRLRRLFLDVADLSGL
jgi:glycyl-tRNA synthetase beta chain